MGVLDEVFSQVREYPGCKIYTSKGMSWMKHLQSKVNINTSKSGSVVVDSLLIVTPIVGFCNCSMFCCALLRVHSSFAIILIGKRKLVALLSLSSWCVAIAVWLFLVVPRIGLQFVIVVFPDHSHLFFFVVEVFTLIGFHNKTLTQVRGCRYCSI